MSVSSECELPTPSGRAGVRLRIELGKAYVSAEEAQRLDVGSIIALNCPPEEPVSVYCGGSMLARGQAVNLDGKFSVLVSDICDRQGP